MFVKVSNIGRLRQSRNSVSNRSVRILNNVTDGITSTRKILHKFSSYLLCFLTIKSYNRDYELNVYLLNLHFNVKFY